MKEIIVLPLLVFSSCLWAAQTVVMVNESGDDATTLAVSEFKKDTYIEVPLPAQGFAEESEVSVTLPSDHCVWDIRIVSEGIPTDWHNYNSCEHTGKKLLLRARTKGGSAWLDYK